MPKQALPVFETDILTDETTGMVACPKEWGSVVRGFIEALTAAAPGETVVIPQGITNKAAAKIYDYVQARKGNK